MSSSANAVKRTAEGDAPPPARTEIFGGKIDNRCDSQSSESLQLLSPARAERARPLEAVT